MVSKRTVFKFCYENTLHLSIYESIIGSASNCPEILNADKSSIKRQERNKYHMIKT